MDFAITDISHSRAVVQIKGLQAREVLKKGSPINFNEFAQNRCAGTVFHGITIVIDSISNGEEKDLILEFSKYYKISPEEIISRSETLKSNILHNC